MDSRNVLKWKFIVDEQGNKKRIIRCRMALRGFKDRDADILETYAGTAGRTSQRLLTSEAANHIDWEFLTIDFSLYCSSKWPFGDRAVSGTAGS